MTTAWLTVTRGDAPLVIGLPHTGTAIAADLLPQFVSPWLARRDADWWIDRLYGSADEAQRKAVGKWALAVTYTLPSGTAQTLVL